MKNIILLCCVALAINGHSQNLKQRTADQYYSKLAYEKAAPIYAELAKKKNASEEVIRRAADSYRQLNAPREAEKWYEKLSTKPGASANDRYNYAQILLRNKKYEAAGLQMKRFYEEVSTNSVGRRYVNAGKGYEERFKADSSAFVIKNAASLNSPESEFAPSYLSKTALVYTSNKENHGANNKDFAWDNTSFLKLYEASIDTQSQAPGKAERYAKKLEISYHNGPACFSPDGKLMLLTRSSYDGNKLQKSGSDIVNLQLYYSEKKEDEWGDLKPFPYNNKDYSFGQACFAPDGKTIYFVSDMPGSYGSTDIWKTRYAGGTFEQPLNAGQEINTEGREMFPFADDDNLLFFASDGHLGLGGLDIHVASLGGNTSYVGNIGYPLNTNADDFGFIYNTKTLKGYFTSNRPEGKGKDDIYMVELKHAILSQKRIRGHVYDLNTGRPVANSAVYLYNTAQALIDSARADEQGWYSFSLKPEAKPGKVRAHKDTYYSGEAAYREDPADRDSVAIFLAPKYSFVCTVRNGATHELMDGVKIEIDYAAAGSSRDTLYYTGQDGTIAGQLAGKKIGDKLEAVIRFSKPGYLTMTRDLNLTLDTVTLIVLNDVLDAQMHKPEKNGGLDKALQINPIYFDLAKWDIRPDAAIELDKLVKVMKENPSMVIELGSHTDCRASRAYNRVLSDKRARSSAAYIISRGIDQKRIYSKGYGESKLVNACECEGENISPCTEEEHQANRRTEFVILQFR